MAKGLSYSPNEALIRGAAAIGMSKLPADQTALGKIAELGAGILKEEGERRQKAEDAIDNTIAQVLADDGTLSDQHFALATKQAQEYKQSYMQGVYMNNDEGNILKQKALNDLQRLANSSIEETELRKNLAKLKEDNLLSDNLDITTFNAYLEHDYILKYEDGKKIYEINGVDYTYDDIKLFAKDLKNLDIKTINDKQIDSLPYYIKHNKETNTKTFDSERFNRISLDSIADTERGFANQMRDNTIGGQQISDLIMNSSTIVEEFEQQFPGFEFVDANGDGVIDRSEKLDMIADAVLNTTNSAFNLENSRQIIADLLTADARNKAQRDGLLYVEPKDNGGDDDDITDYSQYIYVPNVKEGETGEEIQISGDQRRKMQRNIDNKVKNFDGTNGYYVRLSGTKDGKQMYFRFDTYKQYKKALEQYGGKIPSKKENFDKLFPEAKGGYGYNRYIDEARLIELEVGAKINLPLD
jgi:hypothetical protein